MKHIIWLFLLCSFYLHGQVKTRALEFLVGSFETQVYLPTQDGKWTVGGKGAAEFYPILGGSFLREDLNLTFGQQTLTMSNHMGIDGRSGQLRMVAMDKEYGIMDMYDGQIHKEYIVFTNLNSDIPTMSQTGDSLAFRITYRKLTTNSNESLVEITKDQGASWMPYSKQVFTRMDN